MIKSLPSTLLHYNVRNALRKLTLTAAFGAMISLSGCSLFGVYKIELPQGTPITQSQAQKLRVGMNPNQVIYLLGSPAIKDTLEPNRWDYVYDYTAGTQGKRDGIPNVKDASQHLIVYFDDNSIVTRIEGIETLPQP